jgi:6-phosphogluconate dehydrogenase
MATQLEFGVIGLGQIGGGLAQQALEKGLRVVGFDTQGASDALKQAGLVELTGPAEFDDQLDPPRVIFLYVPAGPVVDDVICELCPHLEQGDIVVDGGNSYWGDSMRRHTWLAESGIPFVDLGTSGGVAGARTGACFMAGGERAAVSCVEPILRVLAVEGGYVHTGPPGSGHFVKLVHNGIEFGMLQAIGEGISLLNAYSEPLDLSAILRCWRHGSVIRSWLVELMAEQYDRHHGLQDVPPYVEDTGEVNWLVADAMKFEVEIPVIAASVMQLFASRDRQQDWARAIAMMRHGFGGHPFGPDEQIQREREKSRVGPPPK